MTGKADAVRAVSQQFKDRTNTVIEGVMAHLRDDNAKEILGPGLSPLIGRGDLKSIVKFALYADVLRMVRDMVMADGEISDEEVQESLGLLSVLAAAFAKVRKEYASYTQLSNENARQFFSQYESDAGLFGHANEATKWSGVELCRNIQSDCGDSGPNDAFSGSLVAWAESIAGSDGLDASEQAVLGVIHNLACGGRNTTNKKGGRMGEETLLTKVVAERILDNDDVDLGCYSAIDEAAAAVLSKHCGELCLDGITNISADALLALSPHRGRVSFANLVDIDKVQAEALAGFLSEVDVDIKKCGAEIQSILLKHPSSRIRDNDPEFHNWLLDELGFDDDEDSGRDWVSDEVMEVLLNVCACEQSADHENGVEMRGSGLADIVAAIRNAGAREIHTVDLIDRDNSVLMFVGTLEELKVLLQPAISIENKKKPLIDEDDDEVDDEDL